jgi:hypothetical protein
LISSKSLVQPDASAISAATARNFMLICFIEKMAKVNEKFFGVPDRKSTPSGQVLQLESEAQVHTPAAGRRERNRFNTRNYGSS